MLNKLLSKGAYSPDGLRHSKTVNNEKRVHVWDGMSMVGESVDNSAPTWYIRGANLLWSRDATGNTSYLYNGHNDVVATTGANAQDYLYDAFGNQVDEVSNQPFDWRVDEPPVPEADYNPFRYTGEYFDYETGYVYLRARYYDSSNGRFISEDPIRSGRNWYNYCAGNPVRFGDPMGLKPQFDHDGNPIVPPKPTPPPQQQQPPQPPKPPTPPTAPDYITPTSKKDKVENNLAQKVYEKERAAYEKEKAAYNKAYADYLVDLLVYEFIEYLWEQVDNGSIYVWGAQGYPCRITEKEFIKWLNGRETDTANYDRALEAWRTRVDDKNRPGDFYAFDCSGLGVYWLFDKKGLISGDRSASGLYDMTVKISDSNDLKAGDWVFRYSKDKGIYHVGYVVDNMRNVIHAKGRDDGVVVEPFDSNFWQRYGRYTKFIP